jgi:hypothetical protein
MLSPFLLLSGYLARRWLVSSASAGAGKWLDRFRKLKKPRHCAGFLFITSVLDWPIREAQLARASVSYGESCHSN